MSAVIAAGYNIEKPRAGSGVVRKDPLSFLADCRERRLNQALSTLVLVQFFHCVVAY